MKVLIAYDGSDCADAALDDLQRAGLPPDADFVNLCYKKRLRGSLI